MAAILTGAEGHAHLLTRHSALSYPLLRQAPMHPVQIKRVSGIDRLGNLSARSVTISLVPFRLGSFFTAADSLSPSDIPQALTESLASELRGLVTSRQHLVVGLVPVTHVEALREFFGTNKAVNAGVAVGDYLLNELSEHFLPADLPMLSEGQLSDQIAGRYMGDPREPHVIVGMSPSAWLRTWTAGTDQQRKFVAMAFNGTDSSKISSANYRALRQIGAPVIPSSRAYRSLFSPKFWAYVIIFVYSTLRALPVTFVENFHGSVAFLWAMDVITAIPYTWGLVAFVTAHKYWVRFVGLAVTIITFVAPYAYFWSHGQDYSWWVNAVVVLMIAGAVCYEGFNYWRDHAVAAGLAGGSADPAQSVYAQAQWK